MTVIRPRLVRGDALMRASRGEGPPGSGAGSFLVPGLGEWRRKENRRVYEQNVRRERAKRQRPYFDPFYGPRRNQRN